MYRKQNFQPDYTNILKVLHHQRPDYLPLYEHHIDAPFISKFVFHRMGDDLGHKTDTMLEPDTIRKFILPQHKRVIDVVHGEEKTEKYVINNFIPELKVN